jgi:uncharacterized membrane protein YeaQ/YmgE (transglycosylase-associated protein family)
MRPARKELQISTLCARGRSNIKCRGLEFLGGEYRGRHATFMGNPSVGFFTMILIGAIACWIAEKVTASDHGIFTNILVGIAGAFVGAKFAEVAQIPVFGFFRILIAATFGAIAILFIWRRIQASRQP